MVRGLLLLLLGWLCLASASGAQAYPEIDEARWPASQSSQDGAAQVPQAQDGTGTESTRDFWPGLRRALALFVFLCVVALVLLI
ncbi:MAG: hypothetical protein AAF657_24720, partial [Acidobacteriota bacterium]